MTHNNLDYSLHETDCNEIIRLVHDCRKRTSAIKHIIFHTCNLEAGAMRKCMDAEREYHRHKHRAEIKQMKPLTRKVGHPGSFSYPMPQFLIDKYEKETGQKYEPQRVFTSDKNVSAGYPGAVSARRLLDEIAGPLTPQPIPQDEQQSSSSK